MHSAKNLRLAYASAQSDQSIRCAAEETSDPWLSTELQV